jgi:ribosome maturation factor RimP
MTTLSEKIANLIKPTIEVFGFEYWGLLYQTHDRRGLLRIFIDAPQGVTADDCAAVSRQISSLLDVENLIASAYVLEVSSPGIDRLLFEPSQFRRYINKKITVKLYEPIEGRRNFSGTLVALQEDGSIKLTQDDHSFLLPLSKIQTAQVCE